MIFPRLLTDLFIYFEEICFDLPLNLHAAVMRTIYPSGGSRKRIKLHFFFFLQILQVPNKALPPSSA